MRLLLAHDACYCGQFVDELSLAQATVSQHLKVLKDAGLIVGEIEGLRTCYCASRDRLAELHALVGGILDEAVEPSTTVRVAATEERSLMAVAEKRPPVARHRRPRRRRY